MDFGVPTGTAIGANVAGTVVYAGWGNKGTGYGGYGYAVGVKDANGHVHVYGHLSGVNVKVGQKVSLGTLLGKSGNTGQSKGAHLHYEVRKNGVLGNSLDPSFYLRTSSSPTVEKETKAGFWKTKQFEGTNALNTFRTHLNKAIPAAGVSSSWASALTELFARESGLNPSAKNGSSSAYGYAQFIKSTREAYEKKYGIKYDTPVNQLILGIRYVKDRYGTPEKALQHWDTKGWY